MGTSQSGLKHARKREEGRGVSGHCLPSKVQDFREGGRLTLFGYPAPPPEPRGRSSPSVSLTRSRMAGPRRGRRRAPRRSSPAWCTRFPCPPSASTSSSLLPSTHARQERSSSWPGASSPTPPLASVARSPCLRRAALRSVPPSTAGRWRTVCVLTAVGFCILCFRERRYTLTSPYLEGAEAPMIPGVQATGCK